MSAFERHKNFLDFALSSLLRRQGRNLALILVYTLVVFVIASVIFFGSAIRREAQAILAEAPEIVVQRLVAGRHDLIPLSYLPTIEKIRGVRSAKGRLWGYYFHPASKSNYTIMVPDNFPHPDGEVVVGDGVLRTWGSSPGQGLYFKTYTGEAIVLKIADTFSAGTDLVSADLILTSAATFRRLFGISAAVATDLALKVRNESECATIAEKIVRALPDTRPITREEILRTYAALFDWRSGYIVVILSVSILAFFIFAWDKATGLSAEERREVGILKALGWDTSDILIMKFWEGSAISLTSFLIGVILAYLHVFFASATLFEHALKGWATLFPTFTLRPTVNAFEIATLFFLTVAPYSLITIIPTWSVAVSDPDAVMRQ
jgi:ABC-type lipoprotein release transport system permease subunit